jgi:hypothetical protein
MKFKPAREMVAVMYTEDATTVDPNGGIPAKVVAAGKGSDYEEGDVVLVKPYANWGLNLGDGSILLPDVCIAGKIVEN